MSWLHNGHVISSPEINFSYLTVFVIYEPTLGYRRKRLERLPKKMSSNGQRSFSYEGAKLLNSLSAEWR